MRVKRHSFFLRLLTTAILLIRLLLLLGVWQFSWGGLADTKSLSAPNKKALAAIQSAITEHSALLPPSTLSPEILKETFRLQAPDPESPCDSLLITRISKNRGFRISLNGKNNHTEPARSDSADSVLDILKRSLETLKTEYIDILTISHSKPDSISPLIPVVYNGTTHYLLLDIRLPLSSRWNKIQNSLSPEDEGEVYESDWMTLDICEHITYALQALILTLLPDATESTLQSAPAWRGEPHCRLSLLLENEQGMFYISTPPATRTRLRKNHTPARLYGENPPYYYPVLVKKSMLPGNSGCGVFAAQDIEKDAYIGMVIGTTRKRSKQEYFTSAEDSHNILISGVKLPCDYVLEPDQNNAFRWLNRAYNCRHPKRSPRANVTLHTTGIVAHQQEQTPVTMVKALTNITKGAELLFCYDSKYDPVERTSPASPKKNAQMPFPPPVSGKGR